MRYPNLSYSNVNSICALNLFRSATLTVVLVLMIRGVRNMAKTINVGRSSGSKEKPRSHIPSTVQPDTLFHFVSKREYLFEIIKRKMISPRYCREDLSYLKLRNFKQLAYPMVCFCDIGLQRLEQHMDCYGYYGIAFPKHWCMGKGVQGVQYLSNESSLYQDVREAIKVSRRIDSDGAVESEQVLASFLTHQLMYYKPYQGKMRYRVDNRTRKKCLADECEWRFVPDVSTLDMPMAVSDAWKIDNYLDAYSSALATVPEVSLKFSVQDVKHIIISATEDLSTLMKASEEWQEEGVFSDQEIYQLLSKVLVWDEIKGDF